jgi:hypothetical protein
MRELMSDAIIWFEYHKGACYRLAAVGCALVAGLAGVTLQTNRGWAVLGFLALATLFGLLARFNRA